MQQAARRISENEPVKPVGRMERRRALTRARLLEAAYDVISTAGVDAAKIKDITDRADVGFGTFYNYFDSKDELAGQVLDCVINDLGRRNVIATDRAHREDAPLVMPLSTRLVLNEAIRQPMWQWWALRPDLLVDRMREGFKPFATPYMREAIAQGIFHISEADVEAIWAQSVWMMVGGLHDIVVGERPPESEMLIVESIMRVMGVPVETARRISTSPLPAFPPADIDWSFRLDMFLSTVSGVYPP